MLQQGREFCWIEGLVALVELQDRSPKRGGGTCETFIAFADPGVEDLGRSFPDLHRLDDAAPEVAKPVTGVSGADRIPQDGSVPRHDYCPVQCLKSGQLLRTLVKVPTST